MTLRQDADYVIRESIKKVLPDEAVILTDQLDCVAREAGAFLASIAKTYQSSTKSLAFIAGGETVVHLTGKGKGGRNQGLALAGAAGTNVNDFAALLIKR